MLKKYFSTGMVLVLIFVLTSCASSVELNGKWEFSKGIERIAIEFSERNFTTVLHLYIDTENTDGHVSHEVLETVVRGTFSVSDDQIEFVFDNGDIKTHSFSLTENTLILSGTHYYRHGFHPEDEGF